MPDDNLFEPDPLVTGLGLRLGYPVAGAFGVYVGAERVGLESKRDDDPHALTSVGAGGRLALRRLGPVRPYLQVGGAYVRLSSDEAAAVQASGSGFHVALETGATVSLVPGLAVQASAGAAPGRIVDYSATAERRSARIGRFDMALLRVGAGLVVSPARLLGGR